MRTLAFTRRRRRRGTREGKVGNSNSREFCYHHHDVFFFPFLFYFSFFEPSGVILFTAGGGKMFPTFRSLLTLTAEEIIIWDLNPEVKGIESHTYMTHFIPMHLLLTQGFWITWKIKKIPCAVLLLPMAVGPARFLLWIVELNSEGARLVANVRDIWSRGFGILPIQTSSPVKFSGCSSLGRSEIQNMRN